MKLSGNVLLEIMSIVQDGIIENRDISESLRELDLEVVGPEDSDENRLELSERYLKTHPRPGDWN